jgi:hypothetical protein
MRQMNYTITNPTRRKRAEFALDALVRRRQMLDIAIAATRELIRTKTIDDMAIAAAGDVLEEERVEKEKQAAKLLARSSAGLMSGQTLHTEGTE